MSLAFLIYLISLLQNVLGFLAFIFCTVCAFIMGCLIRWLNIRGCSFGTSKEEKDEISKTSIKYAKRGIISAVLIGLLLVIIPSTKTAWMMVGGYVAQTAYESEAGDKLKKIVSNKLDSILQEQLDSAKEKK